MLKSRDLVICSVLAALGLTLSASDAPAGMFDFLRPKRPAAISTTALAMRGQSPTTAWSSSDGNGFADSSDSDWGYDSSPCMKCRKKHGKKCCWGHGCSPCFNCGDDDHCIWCLRCHRAKCHQTWYPRLAPYCQNGWGWTQPCWRRMPDNYCCPPREEYATARPQPAVTPPPPAAPTAPVIDPVPPEPNSASIRSLPPVQRTSLANRSAEVARSAPRPPQRPAPQVQAYQGRAPQGQARPNRFTSYADTVEPEGDADEEEVDGTIESEMESDEDDAEGADQIALPDVEDEEEAE